MSFLIGILAGLFGGVTGGGGGIISIALMVGIMKFDQHTAHGVSLVALVFTGLAGAIVYSINGSIDVVASILMASTAMIFARIGAHTADSLPEWRLKRAFGAYLIIIALLMLLKPYLTSRQEPATGMTVAVILLITGVVAGFASGMMGVGGGAIMIPAMVLIAGFDQHVAQGTSLLVMVPAGSVGAYTHWKLGNVRTPVLWGLVPGVMVGTVIGSATAHGLSDGALRSIFAALLMFTGIRYLKAKPLGLDADTHS
jgi:uncharacterized membrane protein YfcA